MPLSFHLLMLSPPGIPGGEARATIPGYPRYLLRSTCLTSQVPKVGTHGSGAVRTSHRIPREGTLKTTRSV